MGPIYSSEPIRSLDELARLLTFDTATLVRLASQADNFYYVHKEVQKPDGSIRTIYGVKRPLKVVQKRISTSIIDQVQFPPYLQGGVKDRTNPRSAIKNAGLHSGRRIVLGFDVKNFYPSIGASLVYDLWKHFFGFSGEVADALTGLTTLRGYVPQGASTSQGIGNLVFWDVEQDVVDTLASQGFHYSRFVDDITVSTERVVSQSELEPVFSQVIGMLARKSLKPNRKKLSVATSGHRQQVHGLNVNADRPTMHQKERHKIRAAVFECEKIASGEVRCDNYVSHWERTFGRVSWMKQFHPKEAEQYLSRLHAIKPSL